VLRQEGHISGTVGADRISGSVRRDGIVTGGGSDVVRDIGRNDLVCTGAGDDTVRSDHRQWGSIDLGSGDDRLRVALATRVLGGPGDDRLEVHQATSIDAGGGDVLVSATAWDLEGGSGDDRIVVDHGRACSRAGSALSFQTSPRPIRADLAAGWVRGRGRDRMVTFSWLIGSRYDDEISGSDGVDAIAGQAGADLVETREGNDHVGGGNGADRLYLGAGDDYATGEDGPDRLYGEAGSDYLEGRGDSDYLDGGPDNDELYSGNSARSGGNSYDTVGRWDHYGNELSGGPGSDYLVGEGGNDRLDGGAGFDHGQGGYRDGRIDWIDSLEHLIEDCPTYDEMRAFLVSRY
jgi:Ca2+-binding RTX toxin-like protein